MKIRRSCVLLLGILRSSGNGELDRVDRQSDRLSTRFVHVVEWWLSDRCYKFFSDTFLPPLDICCATSGKAVSPGSRFKLFHRNRREDCAEFVVLSRKQSVEVSVPRRYEAVLHEAKHFFRWYQCVRVEMSECKAIAPLYNIHI